MSHRTLAAAAVAALATATALTAVPAAAADSTPGVRPHPALGPAPAADHLTITVTGSGAADGTYELYCDPAGGTHPDPEEACGAVEDAETPFAATPEGEMCTFIHGGDAAATIDGVWAGEPVHATFDRSNGCEIARWNALVPALPRIGSDQA